MTPKPFIKWAGGKRQLLPILTQHLPERAADSVYVEPFVGGGALLFHLQPAMSIISDSNPEVANAYSVLRDHLEELLAAMAEHRNEESYYYAVRAQNPMNLSSVGRASRFLFLNRTCFNGLYRVNKDGQFNVPFGHYKNPTLVDADNLRAVSAFLRQNQVEVGAFDFREVLDSVFNAALDLPDHAGTVLVYLDPPYHDTFASYTKRGFGRQDQEELAEWYGRLSQAGCRVLLSNSNTDLIRSLYRDFEIVEVEASRNINRDGSKRGKTKCEVLVKNY